MSANPTTWYGVNLGNWFLLERWIKPSLFAVDGADQTHLPDEYSLCQHLGRSAEAHMHRHRETYISLDDFKWMARHGINAVRIPYGYWLIAPEPPFVGGMEMLDQAIAWAGECNITVLLDLHGAPGHQGVEMHCGRENFFQWHQDSNYRNRTLDVIEAIAQRYRSTPAVGAISLLNEPNPQIPATLLLEYYHAAYERVRRHMPAENVAVVAEAFTSARLPEIHGRLLQLGCQNVITDVHLYQGFSQAANDLPILDHVTHPLAHTLPMLQQHLPAGSIMIGEWSLMLADRKKLHALPAPQQDLVYRAFANNQLLTWSHTRGSFFWTYQTERSPDWSLRECINRGWLPNHLAPREAK